MKGQWRYIPFQRYDPYVKTALNDVALDAVNAGRTPLIWLSGWTQDCISVGRGQVVADEVDVGEAERRGIPIVRRQGGGGTTYLTRDGELTWHLTAPAAMFPDDPNAIYEQVCPWIADALDRLDIEAWHEPVNDVVTADGKVSGATCKQQGDAVYVAGTLLYDVDVETMFTVLTPNDDKLADKPIERFEDRVSSVVSETAATFEEAKDALKEALLAGKTYEESEWTEKELTMAEQRAETTYRTKEWVLQHE